MKWIATQDIVAFQLYAPLNCFMLLTAALAGKESICILSFAYRLSRLQYLDVCIEANDAMQHKFQWRTIIINVIYRFECSSPKVIKCHLSVRMIITKG